ncbi:MAG TPA: biopolymer transporter ExbD [Chlamydiales bacterium]|nr:biopolymer transporter ExbD [Chlamydiales bacterium]
MRKRIVQTLEEIPGEPLINLTPLIDVVFVMLISFMLIAPLLEIDSIDLAPGRQTNQTISVSAQNSPFIIYIRSDNSIWLQNQKMSLSDLEKYLLLEKKRQPHAIPKMIPDARCHFETYCQVKNILETCGFEQADLILAPAR